MTIFVSLAAYRDPELVPTVRDLFATAADPDRIRVGLFHQHADGGDVAALRGDPRISVREIDYRDSQGMGWARAEAIKLYDGEDHFLQIDSHHRFVPGWDAGMLGELRRAPSDKPLLSSWCPPYVIGEEPPPSAPLRMVFDQFDQFDSPTFRAEPIDDWQTRDAPMPTGFVCAHFMFTEGSFVTDVPNDPNLYFYGEEITTAVRAFTHGYDAFAPVQVFMWHLWDGTTRRRHWEDHVDSEVERPWWQRERASRRRVRNLLLHPSFGRYGCGTARTVRDYEAFTGISFR